MTSVNDFILPNEEIKYIATYDISTRSDNADNSNISGVSGIRTEVAGVCGFGFIQNTYIYSNTGLLGGPRYIFENYALSSVGPSTEGSPYLGETVWQASYPDTGEVGITSTPIFCFGVSSGTGIYQGLIKVVIDFTNVNRIIYLIGPKQ